jgi:hypothetical protein
MARRETIVVHDSRLVLESLRDFFMCEESAEAPGARGAKKVICGKWRHVPGLRHVSDDNFTCSVAGFKCDDPVDLKWMSFLSCPFPDFPARKSAPATRTS